MPLDALDPLAKEVLVEALVDAISHDGRIAVALTPAAFPPGIDTEDDLARAEAALRDA